MSDAASASPPPLWFAPSWRRLASAGTLAAAGFFLPQEIPLVWSPLNEPGDDILYLELTCAADQAGDVQIFYNTTRGVNERESISFSISPTAQVTTYTFPLPDAPIVELRLDPVAQGGTLDIRRMRVVDRRGVEAHRFTRDMFIPQHEIAAISATEGGWKITSAAGSLDPFVHLELPSPILAHGRDHRNFFRCLLSTGYLAGMLLLLLVAVYFTFTHPKTWRELPAPLAYLALVAVLFALVGNRGLIRNTIHYARYRPPAVPTGLRLELDLQATSPSTAQLFWDTGHGFNEPQSVRVRHEPHPGLQTLRFDLPPGGALAGLRFDPIDGEGEIRIRGIRVVDAGNRTRALLPSDALAPFAQIAGFQADGDAVAIRTTPGAGDPIALFRPEALAAINAALASAHEPAR